MNNRMRELLERLENEGYLHAVSLAPELRALVDSGIIEGNGCFFLGALWDDHLSTEEPLAHAFDRTDLECNVNHVHVEELLDEELRADPRQILAQGVKYAFELDRRLREYGSFRVLLSCRNDDGFTECVVRFHHIRPGEEWHSSDLEGYQEEGVLILEGE